LAIERKPARTAVSLRWLIDGLQVLSLALRNVSTKYGKLVLGMEIMLEKRRPAPVESSNENDVAKGRFVVVSQARNSTGG